MRNFINRSLPVMVVIMMFAIIVIPTNIAHAADINTAAEISYASVDESDIVVGYIDGLASGYSGADMVYGSQNERGTRTKIYYAFASDGDWRYSFDLTTWISLDNSLDEKYDAYCNLTALDVIWNPSMGKWCMYMDISGDNGYSSVVLFVSDSLNGDWEWVAPVVYSGFSNENDAARADYFKISGTDGNGLEWDSRYSSENSGTDLVCGMNTMDPCVFYEDGSLWMAYRSALDGIYMIKLDTGTGLRDYATSYAMLDDVSDPYMGYKIAGGQDVSGTAFDIEKIGGEFYLFLNCDNTTVTNKYAKSVLRAESVTGPYIDGVDDDVKDTVDADNFNNSVSISLAPNYKWEDMNCGCLVQGYSSWSVDESCHWCAICEPRADAGNEVADIVINKLSTAESGKTDNSKDNSEEDTGCKVDIALRDEDVGEEEGQGEQDSVFSKPEFFERQNFSFIRDVLAASYRSAREVAFLRLTGQEARWHLPGMAAIRGSTAYSDDA